MESIIVVNWLDIPFISSDISSCDSGGLWLTILVSS